MASTPSYAHVVTYLKPVQNLEHSLDTPTWLLQTSHKINENTIKISSPEIFHVSRKLRFRLPHVIQFVENKIKTDQWSSVTLLFRCRWGNSFVRTEICKKRTVVVGVHLIPYGRPLKVFNDDVFLKTMS